MTITRSIHRVAYFANFFLIRILKATDANTKKKEKEKENPGKCNTNSLYYVRDGRKVCANLKDLVEI